MFNDLEVNKMPEFTIEDLDLAMYMAAISMAALEDREQEITQEQIMRLAAWHRKFEDRPGLHKITANDLMEHLLNKIGA